jgi:peptidoglycan hydrolase-like protein with peptidoglycan-binding domain
VLALAAASAVAVAGGKYGLARANAKPVKATVTMRIGQVTLPYFAPARVLKQGMSGADVLALQQRLAEFHYWIPAFDGKLSYDDVETLYAFQAMNSLPMTGEVDAATGTALVHPVSYTPRDTREPTRIEVDINKNRQLLVYYKNNSITLISHVSSGRLNYATTPTGEYTANIFMPGSIPVPLGVMINPVFFTVNGKTTVYAIHGDAEVPSYPDSNGCVRIPTDLSNVFYKTIDIVDRNGSGTPIYIYGTNWQDGS